jgi:hypothetical protein
LGTQVVGTLHSLTAGLLAARFTKVLNVPDIYTSLSAKDISRVIDPTSESFPNVAEWIVHNNCLNPIGIAAKYVQYLNASQILHILELKKPAEWPVNSTDVSGVMWLNVASLAWDSISHLTKMMFTGSELYAGGVLSDAKLQIAARKFIVDITNPHLAAFNLFCKFYCGALISQLRDSSTPITDATAAWRNELDVSFGMAPLAVPYKVWWITNKQYI